MKVLIIVTLFRKSGSTFCRNRYHFWKNRYIFGKIVQVLEWIHRCTFRKFDQFDSESIEYNSLALMYDLVHRARSKHHPRLWAFDFFHIGTRDIFQSGFALKIGLSRKVFSSHANDPFFVSQLTIRVCSWLRFQI